MKFTFSIADMLRTLNVLGRVVQKRNTLPILDNVMITKPNPKEEIYFVTGGTAESMMTIQTNISMIDGSEFYPVCIPHGEFLQSLSSLPDQPITVVVDDQTKAVKILYAGGEFTFAGYKTDEYPLLKSTRENLISVSVPSATLLPCMLSASVGAAKNDTLRPVLSSVYLDIQNEGITFVGTNGRALFRYIWSHGVPFISEGSPIGVMVPVHLVSAIKAAFEKSEDVSIRYDGLYTSLTDGATTFVFRTVDGKFPNYNSVIPTDEPYHVTVDGKLLKQAVDRVSMMASTNSELVKITKTADGLLIESLDVDFSRAAKELLPIGKDSVIPDGFVIGVKSSTFLTMLSPIASDNVVLKLTAPERPIVLTEEGNSALTELVMPILIK